MTPTLGKMMGQKCTSKGDQLVKSHITPADALPEIDIISIGYQLADDTETPTKPQA
jgi:hypothetical protein